jgi:hypothetical protein
MDNGVMFAISILIVWALGLGIWLLYKAANRKLTPKPEEAFRPCDGCVFADDFRSPNELIGHRLFGYVRLARASMIPDLPIPDPGRKKLFTDLLDARFKIVTEAYLQWLKVNLPALEDMRADTLASEQLALAGAIVERFEAEARRMGAPDVVLERMRYWEGPRIGHLRSEIQLVCESEWLSDSSQRLGFILSVVEQIMKATVLDAERTLGSLNGKLTGLTYAGFTIGPCALRRGEIGTSPAMSSSGPHNLRRLKQEY